MIALPFVLIVLGIMATAFVVVPLLLRERRIVRRAGMSNATPVCAACRYPLGGWSSPKCPECGHDALTHRVRVRLATIRPIRYGLIVLALVVGAPIAFAICAFTIHEQYREQRMTVQVLHQTLMWEVGFTIAESWRTTDTIPDRTYRVDVEQPGVAAPLAVETDDPTDPAFNTALGSMLTSAFGAVATSEPQLVESTRANIAAVLEPAVALPPRYDSDAFTSIVAAGPFDSNGYGMSVRSGGRLYLATYLVWGAAVLVMLALCIPAARLIGRDGTRPVREQEWELAGRAVDAG